MTPYARALVEARRHADFLDLANGQFHPFGYIHPSSAFADCWASYLNGRSYHPEALGPTSTRRALADWYASRGWPTDPGRFFLTPGTSDAYRLLFTLFCPVHRTLALPLPAYPLFDHLAALAERPVEYYRLDPRCDWALTADALETLSADVAILVLIEPNNPTGRIFSADEIRLVQDWARERKVVVIVDEVFEAWRFVGGPLRPRAADLPECRTVTLNGLSKRWASPDFKLAWGLVGGPEVGLASMLQQLDTALDAVLPVCPFSCLLGERLLSAPDPLALRVQRDLNANRHMLAEVQEAHPGLLNGALPDGGIHWMPQTPVPDDEALAIHLLEEWHLHVQPGYLFGVEDQGYIVLSLLLPPPLFQAGLERLTEALRALTRRGA